MIETCPDCGQIDCECQHGGPRVLAYIFAVDPAEILLRLSLVTAEFEVV